jgi:hypothetical protein
MGEKSHAETQRRKGLGGDQGYPASVALGGASFAQRPREIQHEIEKSLVCRVVLGSGSNCFVILCVLASWRDSQGPTGSVSGAPRFRRGYDADRGK